MKNSCGKLIVIVAPSGTGKSTLMKRVREEFEGVLIESVSYTTRAKRLGEKEGVDYFFINKNQFEKMIEKNEFIEWALVHGDYKGTSKIYVEKKIEKGCDLIFDLDIQGTDSIKSEFGNQAQTIFIKPPSYEVLEKRLRGRGTENEDAISLRLKNAKIELSRSDDYDYLIINDDVDLAYQQLSRLIKELIGK